MQYSAIYYNAFRFYIIRSSLTHQPTGERGLGSQFWAETANRCSHPAWRVQRFRIKKVNIMDLRGGGGGVGSKTPEKPTSSFAYYYIYALFYIFYLFYSLFIFCPTSSEGRCFFLFLPQPASGRR